MRWIIERTGLRFPYYWTIDRGWSVERDHAQRFETDKAALQEIRRLERENSPGWRWIPPDMGTTCALQVDQ